MDTQSVSDGLYVRHLERESSLEPYTPLKEYSEKGLSTDTTASQHDNERRHRGACGLSPLVFATLVALITAIIVGAAVGGGVSAAVKRDCSISRSATATVTVTSLTSPTDAATNFTNYTAPSPLQIESLANDCPRIHGSLMRAFSHDIFRVACQQVHPDSWNTTNGITLSELKAYTLQDCIDACTGMNLWKGSRVCKMVTWSMAMANGVRTIGANCFLLSDSSQLVFGENATSATMQI